MIVDAHTHIVDKDWYPEEWWNGMAKIYVCEMKNMGLTVTVNQVKEQIFTTFYDPDAKKLLDEMDAAGIDISVILPLDLGIALGNPKVSIEEQNQIFAEIQKKHQKRIVAFTSVDPRRPNAVELVRKAIDEWGLKGLKLLPAAGFYPNDRQVYKLLEVANELRVPVLFHTGQEVVPLRSKYCDPIYLDDVLIDFPNLTVQAAHMGFGWRHELFHMGATRPNLVTDFSGWQLTAINDFERFCAVLRECLNEFGKERVLFGTDGPYLRPAMSDKDYVKLIKDLPAKAPKGITFTEEEVNSILGGNAQKIFGIE